MKPKRSLLKRAGKQIEFGVRHVSRPVLDAITNWRHVTAQKRFLVVRHRVHFPKYYDDFLGWLERKYPDVRSLFELTVLPCRVRDWSQYMLLVPWLPDPLLKRSPKVYGQAKDNEKHCQDHGIPVINPVDRLLDTAKSTGAQLIAKAGIRTPHIEAITDFAGFRKNLCGMSLPLLIREDRAHGGVTPIYFIKRREDIKQVPLETFEHPIAVEFIDVRKSKDRLYRKYRYVAAGDEGVSHTLQIADHWEVRGKQRVLNAATLQEEIDYMSQPDRNHKILQHARKIMGLDFAAFDYSYDSSGQMVVWEANILPGMEYPKGPGREHIIPSVERGFAAMAKLYLQRAGLPVPQSMDDLLKYSDRQPIKSAA